MPILVINCGSTSLEITAIDPDSGQRIADLKAERLGSPEATMTLSGHDTMPCTADFDAALAHGIPLLVDSLSDGESVICVGHRVVHGGSQFTDPTALDESVVESLQSTVPLAPLHNPANLQGIRVAMEVLPNATHVAVFDTAFHRTIPRRAQQYALPKRLTEKHGIRRYGFHGTSHQFVAQRAAAYLGEDVRDLRIISCHLGGGCSVCAIENGRSVETSMGMTPSEGLVMSSRSGDLDPSVLLMIAREEAMDAEQLDDLLNRKSGLLGMSGISGDMRDLESKAKEGDMDCQLAIQVFCHRVRKYIGAYAAVMGGVDAIVFTAGIGQNSAVVRHRVSQRLEFLGARLDEQRNRSAFVSAKAPVTEFSAAHSRVRLLAVQTDEAWAIARQAQSVAEA